MFSFFFLTACIERVTDVAVPLDPAFFVGGGDAANPSGAQSALGIPWEGETGTRTELAVKVTNPPEAGTVQFDVVVDDAASPGGVKRVGRVESTTGEVTLSVPERVKVFTLEIFADPGQDGPSIDDPYAAVKVEMAAVPEGGMAVALVVGARPAPSGGGGGGGGGAGAVEPWADYKGEVVVFTGEVACDVEGEIQVDVAEADPSAPGGQKRVGQLRLPSAGAFTLDVPKTLTKFRIEAFVDRAGDGPTADDPYAELTTEVARITVDPVAITLVAGSRGAAGSGGGGPGDGGGGGGGGQAQAPWADFTGSTTMFRAKVVAPGPGDVQVDVNEPDAAAQGGQKRVGQVHLMGSGDLEFPVPSTVASFRIEAFQDPGHDGPSDMDPYAELTVARADLAKNPTLTLVAGSRGQASGPPPGEGTPSDAPTPEQADVPTGPSVKLSGTLTISRPGPVTIDLFQPAAAAGKGRKHLYKIRPHGTTWEALVPEGVGAIEIDAYQDLTGDGPTGDDPQVHYTGAITVSTRDIPGLDLTLP